MTTVMPSKRSLAAMQYVDAAYMPLDLGAETFAMPFRADASLAAAAASMPLLVTPQQMALTMDPATMAPLDLYNMNDMTVEAAFSETFNMPLMQPAATFGNLSWPAAAMPMKQASMGYPPMLRHEFSSSSCSSSSSAEPYIKLEEDSPIQSSQIFMDPTNFPMLEDDEDLEEEKPAIFSTDIDNLMRAIQAKTAPTNRREKAAEPVKAPRPMKKYTCEQIGCGKSFYQKTHLEIHNRAHTGVKPFVCKEPSCGQRFSQLGNLKTHERRHTGERPYQCSVCKKLFAQHGNVRAHMIVHTQAKPFTCKLDGCNKHFTQLGNLKSHQNKFHVDTIRRLKQRFENIKEGDVVDVWEKEMWEYFGNLYKNCNKGIKGRGKDRRINSVSKIEPDTRRDSIVSASSSLTSSSGSPIQQALGSLRV